MIMCCCLLFKSSLTAAFVKANRITYPNTEVYQNKFLCRWLEEKDSAFGEQTSVICDKITQIYNDVTQIRNIITALDKIRLSQACGSIR